MSTDRNWKQEFAPPYAEVTRVGRFRYRIAIHHGLMIYGPGGYGWHRIGERRAQKCAKSKVAAYAIREARESSPIRIELTAPPAAVVGDAPVPEKENER